MSEQTSGSYKFVFEWDAAAQRVTVRYMTLEASFSIPVVRDMSYRERSNLIKSHLGQHLHLAEVPARVLATVNALIGH